MYRDHSSHEPPLGGDAQPPAPSRQAPPAAVPAAPAAPGLRQRLLREPLTHFLLLGVLIFLVAHAIELQSKRYRIAVSPADVTRIVNSYVQQYGAQSNPAQVGTMIDNYIREEIYLRKGLALGLDQNDEIVRRRIAQKYDFLQQDMAVPREPAAEALAAYYAAHRADFTIPAKRSFDHVYFAIDQRGEAEARRLAGDAAGLLAQGQAVAGDAFPGPKVISNLSRADTVRLFGSEDFAASVFAAPTGRWTGPLRTGFGWHAVRVTGQAPSRERSLAEARDDVRAAWIEADRIARNRQGFEKLLARYTIERADRRP